MLALIHEIRSKNIFHTDLAVRNRRLSSSSSSSSWPWLSTVFAIKHVCWSVVVCVASMFCHVSPIYLRMCVLLLTQVAFPIVFKQHADLWEEFQTFLPLRCAHLDVPAAEVAAATTITTTTTTSTSTTATATAAAVDAAATVGDDHDHRPLKTVCNTDDDVTDALALAAAAAAAAMAAPGSSPELMQRTMPVVAADERERGPKQSTTVPSL